MSNTIDAFIPQLWANESVLILQENMVAPNLVHRDFENIIQNYGDTVNTRKPGEFASVRKINDDSVTDQAATATNIPVKLNQHAHVSFVINDGEESKSFKNLLEEYLRPAMLAQARFVDQVVLGQYPQFLANNAGHLGQISSSNSANYMLDTRKVMNINKVYEGNRNLIWGPVAETEALKNTAFFQAYSVGDSGQAMQEAVLGRKFGFNNFMCQNMGYVATGNTSVTGAVNNALGYAKGATSITCDGLSAAIAAGTYVTLAGDDFPQRVVSTTGGATPTAMVITPGLQTAVVDNAVIAVYTPGQVNNVANYAAGWSKMIVVDTFTVAPQTGQLVAFGDSTQTAVYTIIGTPTTTSILLDRPLDVAINDNDKVCIGPPGSYNLAFHKNAMSLVIRPLALPKQGTGAIGAVASDMGISQRVVITYDGAAQGHRVTFDMLLGIAILDAKLGAVMLG